MSARSKFPTRAVFPSPDAGYSRENEAQFRRAVENALQALSSQQAGGGGDGCGPCVLDCVHLLPRELVVAEAEAAGAWEPVLPGLVYLDFTLPAWVTCVWVSVRGYAEVDDITGSGIQEYEWGLLDGDEEIIPLTARLRLAWEGNSFESHQDPGEVLIPLRDLEPLSTHRVYLGHRIKSAIGAPGRTVVDETRPLQMEVYHRGV